MITSTKHKHIQIHVPKTGGSSLQHTAIYNGWHSPMAAHTKLPDIAEAFDLSGFYRTVMVRNPWSHAVSMYYQIMEPTSFSSFNHFKVEGPHTIDNVTKSIGEPTFLQFVKIVYERWHQSNWNVSSLELPFDKWFKFEEYQDMLDFLNDKFNVDLCNIEVNATKHKRFVIDMEPVSDYRQLYSTEAHDIVRELSKWEIDTFDYKF